MRPWCCYRLQVVIVSTCSGAVPVWFLSPASTSSSTPVTDTRSSQNTRPGIYIMSPRLLYPTALWRVSGKSSLSRMPPLGFTLELDEGTTSRQCCTSCTGFQSSDESTSNWRVLSSRHCLARQLRTCLTTYVWSWKGLDAGSACLPTDRVLFRAHTTHSVTEVLLLPGHVSRTASQQTYVTRTSPTRVSGVKIKTYWFSCGRGTM